MPAPIKIFGNLLTEVVNKGLCMYCGTCIASCPVTVLTGSNEEKPAMKGICQLCEICYYSCPRIEFSIDEAEEKAFGRTRSAEEKLGVVKEAFVAKATDNEVLKVCQDGGVTTALEIYALQSGFVDHAVLTEANLEGERQPTSLIASNRAEALRAAGSIYSPAGSISGIGDAASGYPNSKLMYVGLPCQIQGLSRLVTSPKGNKKLGEQVVVSIGLFCMDCYHHNKLIDRMKGANVNLKDVTKTDIKNNVFKVFEGEKILFETPIKQLNKDLIDGCSKCQDFSAELADISIGAMASPDGWCTVLVRSEIGEKLFKGALAKKLIQAKRVRKFEDLNSLVKMSNIKRRREAPYLKEAIKAV